MSSLNENSLIRSHLAGNLWRRNLHLLCHSKTRGSQAWPVLMELKIKTRRVMALLSDFKSRNLKTASVAVKTSLVRITSSLQVIAVGCPVSQERTLRISSLSQYKTINQIQPKESILSTRQPQRCQRMFAQSYQRITLISKLSPTRG